MLRCLTLYSSWMCEVRSGLRVGVGAGCWACVMHVSCGMSLMVCLVVVLGEARLISRREPPHAPPTRSDGLLPPTENKNTHPLQPLRRLFTTELCIYGPHKAVSDRTYSPAAASATPSPPTTRRPPTVSHTVLVMQSYPL